MKTKFFTFWLVLLTSTSLFSQVRRDIYDFTPAQRAELADLIIEFVDADIIEMHCNFTDFMTEADHIHSDFSFLPFHRLYLEKLEDFLLEKGYPQYVPLPKWSPATNAPDEFKTAGPNGNGIDPDCGVPVCTQGNGPCNDIVNWNPNFPQQSEISLPVISGPNNDLCDWPFTPSAPILTVGNTDNNSNGLSYNIENPYHNPVHGIMGGVMGSYRSPAAAIFWIWHAYVDDIWKSWECNCPQSTTLAYDLYMKDNDFVMQTERDRGEEPNIDNGPMWVSKDIWVRNQNDGYSHHSHQNPEYHASNTPNYVYVQIRNRGCVDSPAGETLEVYWAKASTALDWDDYWNGTIGIPSAPNTPLSGLVGTVTLPSIAPGSSYIAEIPWVVPNPADYNAVGTDPVFNENEPHHFCLAAKFESQDDPLVVNTTDMYNFVKGNNNVVWKNISVVDLDPNSIVSQGGSWNDLKIKPGATIFVGDATGNGGTYDLEFTIPTHIDGLPVTEEAEIRVILDEPLWKKWVANGLEGVNVSKIRRDTHEIIITEDRAVIKNLPFEAHERYLVNVKFNFLIKEMSGQDYFEYDVNQLESATGNLIGGERYEIHVPVRDLFIADAGPDKEIKKGESTQLNAFEVSEPATYKWYDSNGKLAFVGKDITVSPAITTTYKLEVMAKRDGAVDYDDVLVSIKPHYIESISPNPVQGNNNMQVKYSAQGATSAYLKISQPYGNTYNHVLDPQQGVQSINTSYWNPGYYVVVLICDGEAVDTVNIIVQ